MHIFNDNIELFREAIRRIRTTRGISQKELALMVGYKSGSTISKIECGIYPSPISKVEIFADALNVSPDELISPIEKSGLLFEGEFIKSP